MAGEDRKELAERLIDIRSIKLINYQPFVFTKGLHEQPFLEHEHGSLIRRHVAAECVECRPVGSRRCIYVTRGSREGEVTRIFLTDLSKTPRKR